MRRNRAVRLPLAIIFCALLPATLAALLLTSDAAAHTGAHCKTQVRLAWPADAQFEALRSIEDLDPMRVVPGAEIVLVSHADQIARLESLGFEVEVQIPDMEEYYATQRTGYRNFGLLYTYSEMIEQLDLLHAQYPEITTERFSIGTTWEGRDLWAIKVSDNPDMHEDEPEVLFDALHHAREPITVNVLIETIRHLCENYGTDPEVTFLVDNRQTYFVPVVNPDGYCYNEQTYPGGGGMWRKNRRAPTGGCWGVDPNRNYPYEWGGVGSSNDPCSDVYHGPEPASEPCVQALMGLINSHEFVTHDSYHSVVGIIIFPWGYTNEHTEDDALFREIAAGMSEFCGYDYGQPGEILYNCSGVTIDWTYGEQVTKPKIFSFTTEVSGSGFWPSDSEVDGLVAENVPKNLYLMEMAGCYLSIGDVVFNGGDGDGLPDPGETLDMIVTVHNDGLIADAEDVALTLRTNDAYVQLHDATSSIGTIAADDDGSNASNPFSLTIDPACPEGHNLIMTIEVTASGFALAYDENWPVGDLAILFADDMESGVGDWIHEIVTGGFVDQWHQSAQRNHTPGGTTSWKFGDQGSGDYANLADGALITPPFDAHGLVELSFWHWMDAEESSSYPGRAYDGGLIEMSLDGGPWEQVTPEAGYTHTIREGSNPGPFAAGTPCFSGQFDWREDVVLRMDLAGSVQFRFRFGSDGADTREGWYVDDVQIAGSDTDNLSPSAPLLVSPVDGETVYSSRPTLTVANAADPDPGDVLTYGFHVFSDALLTTLVTSVDGVEEGTTTTSWMVTPPLEDGSYYWRAYAFDGTERGPCMDAAQFTVEGGQGVPEELFARGVKLLGVSPNPAPGWTALRFSLGSPGLVRGEIFDPQGRRVCTLGGLFQAGPQALRWDGRDASGNAAPGGVYLYRLGHGDEAQSGRILMVR